MSKLKTILNTLLGIGPINYYLTYRLAQQPMNLIIEGNAVIFINQGTSTVTIDSQIIILPNQSFSVPGELFEQLEQSFSINFSTGTGALLAVIKTYR